MAYQPNISRQCTVGDKSWGQKLEVDAKFNVHSVYSSVSNCKGVNYHFLKFFAKHFNLLTSPKFAKIIELASLLRLT